MKTRFAVDAAVCDTASNSEVYLLFVRLLNCRPRGALLWTTRACEELGQKSDTCYLNPSKCELFLLLNQTQIGGKKNSVVLQKLTPDTPYSITVAAIYATGESKDISGGGKTSKRPCYRLQYRPPVRVREVCRTVSTTGRTAGISGIIHLGYIPCIRTANCHTLPHFQTLTQEILQQI